MNLQTFIKRLAGWNNETFLARFPNPFLLEVGSDANRRVHRIASKSDGPVIVGRGKASDIRIFEPSISTVHAKLLPPKKSCRLWQIVDCGSSNGTTVDGETVATVPCLLPYGASLSLGQLTHFQFLDSESLLEQLPAFPPAVIDTTSQPTKRFPRSATHFHFDSGVFSPAGPAEEGELLLYCSTLNPMELKVGQTLGFGRSPKADFVLPDQDVSRRHAEVQRRKDGVFVHDLDSSNGTTMEGVRIGSDWIRLPAGTTFAIGKWEFHTGSPASDTQIVTPIREETSTSSTSQ